MEIKLQLDSRNSVSMFKSSRLRSKKYEKESTFDLTVSHNDRTLYDNQ